MTEVGKVQSERDWSFLWRPRWIISHLLVLALIALMISLGLWQLDRLDEKREINDLIEARAEEPVVDVDELVDEAGGPDDLEYRAVSATGRYVSGADVRVSNRSMDGAPGDWIMSTLELDGGGSIVVNRGFLPRALVAETATYATPTGDVEVEGWLLEGAAGGAVGTPPASLADAPPEVSRPDVELIADVAGVDGLVTDAVYIQSQGADQAGDIEGPIPVPLPELSEGTHLSYAVQWFLFTAIAIGGYPLVLRRIARADRTKGDVAFDPGDEPGKRL